jgi:hypothetical protein
LVQRRLHDGAQRFAVDPLHHDVEHSVFLAEIDGFDDVRMANARCQTGLG